MDKENIVTVLLAVLVLVSLFQTLQLTGLATKITGGAPAAGETYEQMMQRMHGSTSSATGRASAGPTMVGGC